MARTQYVKSEGVSLAYQVLGEAGPNLLHVPGAISNLALEDNIPANAGYFERLSRFCRVVRFDKRGTGLSDPGATPPTVHQQVPDVEAVRRATSSEQVDLYGLSQGAAVAVLYASAFPARTTHLILVNGVCCDARDPHLAISDENRLLNWGEFFARLEGDFESFTRDLAVKCFPDFEPAVHDAFAGFFRATAGPATFASLWRGIMGLDLRPVLRDVAVPTLVLHARRDRHHPVAQGRYLAEHIPGAQYLELDTSAHVPHHDAPVAPQMLAAIEKFLTGTVCHTADRVLVTVLFTDIVDSTAQQRAQGDRAWRSLLESYEAATRRLVEQFGGRVVKFQGDGVMAVFPTPGEGLRAGREMVVAARDLGIDMRAGVHAGEAYEVDGDLFGTCVNVAARVVEQAGRGEVLTTDIVRGLLEGSGFAFADIGDVDLKGIGPRRLVRLA